MCNKQQETYRRVFEVIRANIIMEPQSIMMDFEVIQHII